MALHPPLERFYPIVPDAAWLLRLAPLGISTVQLRFKGQSDAARGEVRAALAIAKAHRLQLIINDFWQIALEEGADFVHLGQEDLTAADVKQLKARGVRLGISTHDEAELETALAAEPDYIALGPIYETKLKAMKWAPQGLARVGAWKKRIGDLPLVAIGGITPDSATGVLAAGADSIAVITDFFTHIEPEKRVETWVAWSARRRKMSEIKGLPGEH